MALSRRKIPQHPKSPMPVAGFPMGPAHSLAVGRMASQQLYMEAEQQPTEGIVLFKPTILLIRGLEILGVPSPWDCSLQGCLPSWERHRKALPRGANLGLVTRASSIFCCNSLSGEPALSTQGAVSQLPPHMLVRHGVWEQESAHPEDSDREPGQGHPSPAWAPEKLLGLLLGLSGDAYPQHPNVLLPGKQQHCPSTIRDTKPPNQSGDPPPNALCPPSYTYKGQSQPIQP